MSTDIFAASNPVQSTSVVTNTTKGDLEPDPATFREVKINTTTPSAIKINNSLSFTIESNLTKFNLGNDANAYIIGDKLIILSKQTLDKVALSVQKYKEVVYNYMYILDIQKEKVKGTTTTKISALEIPDKSEVKINDNFVLINKDNPIPKDYRVDPKQLVDLKKVYKFRCSGGNGSVTVRTDFAQALKKMFTDASKQGIKNFLCNSGYRSISYQEQLFNTGFKSNMKIYKNKETAMEKTRLRVAYPGTSEHNYGIALDILRYPNTGADNFKYTKEAKWLKNNCYKYGFIIRYPEGKTNFTHTMYEPWHIRYVGLPYSKLFQSTGLCFEEIVTKIKTNKYITFNDGKEKYILIYSKTDNLFCSSSITIQRSILTFNKEYVTLIKYK